MVTTVDICNLSLSYIGDVGGVTDVEPSDGSTQADLCARYYPMARETLLDLHRWNFQTKRAALVESDSESDNWLFAYELPPDMLAAIDVLPAGLGTSEEDGIRPDEEVAALLASQRRFAIELDEDGEMLLWTNTEDATLLYTAYVIDPQAWPPLFVQALAWKLAAMLAGPLLRGTEGARMATHCEQMFDSYLGKAQMADTTQRRTRPGHVPPWMSNR